MSTKDVRNPESPSFQGQDQGLSPTDLAILRLLDEDARRSYVDIASLLGVSERTVRNRMLRLRERGLRFRVDFLNLRSHPIIYLVQTRPGSRFPLAERLRNHTAISRLFVTNGSTDLVIMCRFRSEAAQLNFEAVYLGRDPDVTSFEVCSPVANLVNDEVSAAHSRHAVVAAFGEEQITRSLTLLPRFRNFDEALHWLANFLRRAYSADYAYVTTRSDHIDLSQHLLAPGKATANFPISYITELGEEVRQVREAHPPFHEFPLLNSIHSRKHIIVSNVETNELLSPALKKMGQKLGFKSIVTFPMSFGSEIIGAAALYFAKETKPDASYLSSVQRSLDFFIVALRHKFQEEASASRQSDDAQH